MNDLNGPNPYSPYTQQNADWERRKQEQETQRFYDDLNRIAADNRRRNEELKRNAPAVSNRPPAPAPGPSSIPPGTPSGYVPSPSIRRESSVKGMAVVGAAVGFLWAAGAGASIVGGLVIGALLGALVIPVLRLVGWVTAFVLKVALFAFAILLAFALLRALFGGA